MARRRADAIVCDVNQSETARPIRICLALLPGLARDLLREIFAAHADIDVDLRGEGEAPAGGCDVLVTIAREPRVAGIAFPALVRSPMQQMLVVTIDGATVMMLAFRPRQQLIDPSPDAFVAAIRREVAQLRDGARR